MEKNSHGELDVLERQKLRKSMGDLKAGASNILLCDSEKDKSESGNLKKLVEQGTQELRSQKNELTAKLDYSTKIQNVLVKSGKQPPIDDDTSQQDHGISASLTHHEVYSFLRALPNPAAYVLELVQKISLKDHT
ncbi:unnamed protein product [Microthlaspi erraticum]|uniref:Uncharacterized protein n=1 Tax=Microthlaspi erraticum TaxID=1685480 RepID=A0A6D2IX49_9BRAS|nr:unnamed protein product [Microthlaspi erraticum]